MNRDAWIEINLDNLRHNIKHVMTKIKDGTKIVGVVKADAYGHGYEQVTKIFIEEGVDTFALATLEEAMDFKEKFPDKNAIILGIHPIGSEKTVIEYGIEQSVQSYEDAKKLDQEAAKQGAISKIHINIDTGMSRFGFVPSDEEDMRDVLKIFELKNTDIKGIFTHFSSSSDEDWKEVCRDQITLFQGVLDHIEHHGYSLPKIHVSNSGSTLLTKDYNYDMVRMGIISYGLKPSPSQEIDNLDLRPLMSLKARVVRIRNLKKGRCVGYSRTYQLIKDERIATLPLGYADGLRAAADNSYRVYLNGERHHLAGRICMDAMMIRLKDGCEVKVGDEVTLFGYHEDGLLPIEELADALGFINYELASGLKIRLKRKYIYNGKFIEG